MRKAYGTVLSQALAATAVAIAGAAVAVNVCLADVSNVDSRYFADYDPSTSTVTGA